MENQPTLEEATFSVQEPPDLERAATLIQELLVSDKSLEAVVRFSRFRPPDQADVMAQLSRDTQAELLSRLTASSLGTIMEELAPEEAVELSQDMEPERLSQVLDETSPDVAADVLRGLPEDLASTTLQGMEEAGDVTPLLAYEDDDAGGLMTPEFIALRESMTVARAMDFVREHEEELDPEDISHLFILGRDGVLKGDINLAQLVLARPYQRVALLMRSGTPSRSPWTPTRSSARA
jgi:magnesium transporter